MKKLLFVLAAGLVLVPVSSFAEQPKLNIQIIRLNVGERTVLANSAAEDEKQTQAIDAELTSHPQERASAILLINLRTDDEFLAELDKLKQSTQDCGVADNSLRTMNTNGMLEMNIIKYNDGSDGLYGPDFFIHFPIVSEDGKVYEKQSIYADHSGEPLTKRAVLKSVRDLAEKNGKVCNSLRRANAMSDRQLNKEIGSLTDGPAVAPSSGSRATGL